MNIIFSIEGGIGKSVMATAVIEGMHKKYPKENLIVISAYPTVFMGNPYVHKVYSHAHLEYFYKDIIEGQQVKAFLHNPYHETNYITRSEHLLETWFNLCGLKYRGESPQLFISQREIDFYSREYLQQTQKPIMVVQTNGGSDQQPVKYSWMRDIPNVTAQEVVNNFKDKYDIFHIRREDQFTLENTIPVNRDFRSIAVLIGLADKLFLMDSFAQHVAKARNKDAVVCWIGNSPNQFGYENNTNILANPETRKPELKFSVFNKYNISGDPIEFPYDNESQIFNLDDIINALLK